jgi:hypothetical protein
MLYLFLYIVDTLLYPVPTGFGQVVATPSISLNLGSEKKDGKKLLGA